MGYGGRGMGDGDGEREGEGKGHGGVRARGVGTCTTCLNEAAEVLSKCDYDAASSNQHWAIDVNAGSLSVQFSSPPACPAALRYARMTICPLS